MIKIQQKENNMDFNVVKLDIDKLILVLQDCLDKISHLGLKDATHLTGNVFSSKYYTSLIFISH
jgi:hypothetical protein